jgi:thiol:disulfide interchange protein DsbD
MQFADFMTSGLQTASATVSAVTQSASAWQPFSAAAVAGAHASNRPIIIDFTASWCTNCHALERTVFTDPQVAAKLGEFTTLRSDVTDFYSPGNTALEKEYNVTQLPAVLFLDATGKEVPATRVTGLVSASDFAARMAKAEGLGG